MSLKDQSANVAMPVPEIMRENNWTYGLFGCCNDMNLCMKSCCCFPCAIADASAALDNNPPPFLCCYPGDGFKIRQQAEAQFAIRPSGCCTNLMTVCCCSHCSVVQVQREINARRAVAQMAPQQVVMVAQPGVQLQYA